MKKYKLTHFLIVTVMVLFFTSAHAVDFIVTVDEGLFSEANGTGDMDVSDINLSLSGGAATSPIASALAHTAGQNNFTLSVDVTGIPNGQETLTVGFQPSSAFDVAGNAVTDAFDVAMPDMLPPAGYAVEWLQDPIDAGNQTSVSFEISGAEINAGYSYTITSTGGAEQVSGSGMITQIMQSVGNIDVSSLAYGTLTLSLVLTDAAGNSGDAVVDQAFKNAGWSPLLAGELELWLDAADSSTITQSGNDLTAWTDKSGNQNVTVGTNGPNLPQVTTESGGSAIFFNGNTGQSFVDVGADIPATRVFFVVRWNSTQPGLSCLTTTKHMNYPWSIRSASLDAYRGNGSEDANGWVCCDNDRIRVNGSTGVTHNRQRHILSARRGTNVEMSKALRYIGSSEFSTQRFFEGYLHEALWFTSVMTTEQVEQVEGYLAHKWGLQASLPNDHPYKTAPP